MPQSTAIQQLQAYAKQKYGTGGTQDQWNMLSNHFRDPQGNLPASYSDADMEKAKGIIGGWAGQPAVQKGVAPGLQSPAAGGGGNDQNAIDAYHKQLEDAYERTYGTRKTYAEIQAAGRATTAADEAKRAAARQGGTATPAPPDTPPAGGGVVVGNPDTPAAAAAGQPVESLNLTQGIDMGMAGGGGGFGGGMAPARTPVGRGSYRVRPSRALEGLQTSMLSGLAY